MTAAEQRAAKEFADEWRGRGYEKGESQLFWISLLRDVYGVDHPEQFIVFEEQVLLDHTSFIDAEIPATHVLIEQKGIDKDLSKPVRQSDGTWLAFAAIQACASISHRKASVIFKPQIAERLLWQVLKGSAGL